MEPPSRVTAFGAFFRRYARSWYHAVAAAAMTALGTLTVVDDRFAVLALLAYAVPPLALYGRQSVGADAPADTDAADAATESEPSPPPDPAWTAVPTDETLTDAAVVGDRAYAVGAAGTLLCDEGGEWDVAVADGPDAESAALRGVAATADGVWFSGDSGVVGRYDPESGRHVSHSAPDGDTTNVAAVAAAGEASDETVLLADGAGRLRRGRYRDGDLAWDDPVTPASGSSLSGVVLPTAAVGYACDTNQTVVRTDDGGRTFDRVGVDAGGTLTDVAAESERCLVCDDAGVVHRYDGGRWTPERVDDGALRAVAVAGDHALACGPSGTVFERGHRDGWTRLATPASGDLRSVAVGDARAVAVGENGAVVEWPRDGR
ncbi:hypothetical protein [Haloarcula onubensis]|uniref:WD40 repeat domain-containing protein n=1 Tax=Haloarcula onubensis TaxID=2950539 RepID=A0ABU2FQ48_9EURY|nr:hypothetical protein [Halomicroarcula sp. S3CR25-11]MDS0282321.1 hypothetical protein [Halomicroarcula sp. S3CR25-11]